METETKPNKLKIESSSSMIRPTFGTAVLPGVIPSVAPEVILTTGFTSIFARLVVPLSTLSGILAHELFS